MFVLRKIKYKKGRKVQPSTLEYTGIHKDTPTEMQMFVYNTEEVIEFQQCEPHDLDTNIDDFKVNWINIHGLNKKINFHKNTSHIKKLLSLYKICLF